MNKSKLAKREKQFLQENYAILKIPFNEKTINELVNYFKLKHA